MGGSFACPECGNALRLKGLTPGRQVRCNWCQTWVEVPFLPRVGRGKRGFFARRRMPRWARWAWAGLIPMALLLLAVGLSRGFQTRERQIHEQALARLTVAAQADERAGRYGPALATIEAALVEADKIAPRDDARLDALRGWSDRVARREIEIRLAEVARLAPKQAVGACLTLLARIRDNPRLGSFEEAVGEHLERSRKCWVEADLAAARQAFDADHPVEVLALCERLVETANTLPIDLRRRARAEADALIATIIHQRGVLLGSIGGTFTLGSELSYRPVLDPLIIDALRQSGYLPRPASSFWQALWDEQAPFRVEVEVSESYPGLYQESQNRTSSIRVSLILNQKGKDRPAWERVVTVYTRPALHNLPAFQAGRLAVSNHRDPAVEQLFYDDARAILRERLGLVIGSLPKIRSPLSSTPTTPVGGS